MSEHEQARELPLRDRVASLEQRITHLEKIIEISQTLNTTLSLEPLLEAIIQAAVELTDTEGCAVMMLDEDKRVLRVCVATGPNRELLRGRAVPLENSIAGWILLENKPVLVENPQEDPRFYSEMDQQTDFETRSIVGVPLQARGKVIGVLEAVNKKSDQAMTWTDVELLNILADQAAVAIENARLYSAVLSMKEYNESLVQNVAEGIVVTDAEGIITFVNPAMANLLGYTREELVGHHWTAIVAPDQHPIVEAATQRRARGESDRYRLDLVRQDGRRTPVLASGSPRYEANAEGFAGSIAVFTDITQALVHEKVEQELALAWQIQASFLPDNLPKIPDWQLTATLEPARQTSGDFFDVIPLPNRRYGIIIADVAGKGMGAALYMAVSRTLLRTHAVDFHTQPEMAFRAANRRILVDTHTDLFVTVFYGVLDPGSGRLTYCNAGHNPPFILSPHIGGPIQALSKTGLPLGIFEDGRWEQRTVQLAPGDTLLLYTDGVTEAENASSAFFGQERLLHVAQANLGRSAQAIQEAVLGEVHAFVGDAPQFDDIALMVLVRGLL